MVGDGSVRSSGVVVTTNESLRAGTVARNGATLPPRGGTAMVGEFNAHHMHTAGVTDPYLVFA